MNLFIRDEGINSPSEIRTYSRGFLLQLQFTPFTIRKPVFTTEEPGIVFDELIHDPEQEYHKLSRTKELSDDDDDVDIMDTTDHSRAENWPSRNRGRRPRGHRGGFGRGSETANENGQPMFRIPIYEDGKEISRETPSNDRPPRGRGGRGRGRNINSSERGRHQRHRSNSRQRRGSQDSQDNVNYVANHRRNSSANIHGTTESENVPGSDKEKKRRGRIFGYKLLKELSESDLSPDLLAYELLDTRGGFEELLSKDEMNVDWMIYLLQILARIIGTQQKQTLLDLLNFLWSKRFIQSQLIPLLNKISMDVIQITDISTFVHNVFTLCKTALERLPEEYLPPCNLVLILLKPIVQRNPNGDQTTEYTISEDIQELDLLLQAVRSGEEERKKAIENEAAKRGQKHLECEDMPPPDDFRELAILPALNDLDFNQRPFLRVNKIEGSYDDLDHYLDVQFRLLREDYVQPLRKGILQYRIEKEQGKPKRLQDIRLYEKVHIVRSACSNDGVLHVLQFDVSKMTKVRWESSKRLLYGSLVCLSPDDFETIYFATVTNRDTKELTNGFIQVRFEQNLEEVRLIGPSESFIMAETTAYFEAYRHTLRGLQQIDASMPFQSYIVKCQSTMKPPKYLLQHGKVTQYDFEPLVKSGQKELNYPVINTRTWPTATEMNLDGSQYRALQLAITKELAIIQGPPGTGKTHIGLKIAELLLHNTSVWNESKELNPILIVCYTNHALDQFLEGILEFCTSVVRIGGRCNSEKLEPYKLNKIRMSARRSQSKSVTLTIQKRKSDCRRQMSKERDKIEDTNTKLYTTRLGIMHESILKKYIQTGHFQSLCSDPNGEKRIIQWLGIDTSSKIGLSELDDITATDPLLSTWKQTILNYDNKMELKEALEVLKINNIWELSLENRVRLYKYLTTLVRRRLENNILEVRNRKRRYEFNPANIQQEVETWDRNLEYIESNILNEDQLLTYLPDNFKLLVMKMKSQKPQALFIRKNQTVTEQWLCLDGTEESRQTIRKTMKSLDDEDEFIDVEEEATMVEQERKIEDDDDFQENEGRIKITSHVEFDDLAMVAFKTTTNGTDEEEGDWITVKSKEKQKKLIRKILFGKGTFSDDEISKIENIWELSFDEKAKLYRSWLSKYQIELKKSIEECERRFIEVSQSYREAMDMEDAELIRNTKVVAMTTTGAAKFRVILQTIKPRIIIVEEAAEVLESHIVTALNENCQHLILIGDHKQLRPSPTVYQLATKYKLEISLFERMINNEINYETLELQHRMRPEISVLMQHIYPELKDHTSVLRRPNILGLDDNIFFITHKQQEHHSEETRSRSNIFEAKFAVELCRYFMNQGYLPQQITILAAYSGQIFELRKLMPKTTFNGVRVTAVDNFQGEENDIIILSLVRSNEDNSIGFLSIDNRVCVALSRARQGFYIIGNIDLLACKSSLWASIESTLKEKQAIGPKLRLRCQNHREKVTEVSKAEDFSLCRGGGCDKFCDARLKCGHACKKTCHIADKNHILHKCTEICGKTTCPAGHTCKRKCFQECGQCTEPVLKIHPVCGHSQTMPCHTDPHLFNCQDVCRKRLPCGHECQGVCGTCSKEHKHKTCKTLCRRKLSCGHIEDIECYMAVESYKCSQQCDYTLDCGHKCRGTCGDCFGGAFHVPCQEKCKTTLICGHICNQSCGKPCQTCPKACQVSCQHSKCKDKCGFPCTGCKEKCDYICEHYSCSKLCGELCNRLPCSNKCPGKLPCKHKCMGLCGEPCPSVCFICDSSKAKTIYPYCTENTTFVVLEDCRHIFESTSLDDWIFERDTGKGVFIEMLRCPQCSKPITNSKRYGRFINTMKESVDKIKSNLNINSSNFARQKLKITTRLREGKRLDQTFIDTVLSCLEDQIHLPMENFDCLENQIIFLSWLGDISEVLDQNSKLSLQQPCEVKEMHTCLSKVRSWVLNMRVKPNRTSAFKSLPRKYFTVLELDEISYEILRIDFIVQVLLLLQHGIGSTWMDSATKGDILETLQTMIDTKKFCNSDIRLWTYKHRRLLQTAGSPKNPCFKLPTRAKLVQSRTFVERKWCKCSCGCICELKKVHPPGEPCKINCNACQNDVNISSINEVPFVIKKNNEDELEEKFGANKEIVKQELNWKTVKQTSENNDRKENLASRWRSVDNEVDLSAIESINEDGVRNESRKNESQTMETDASNNQIYEWKTVEKNKNEETIKTETQRTPSNIAHNANDIIHSRRWVTVRQTSVDKIEQERDRMGQRSDVLGPTGTSSISLNSRTEKANRTENRWITVNQNNKDNDNNLTRKTKENEDKLRNTFVSDMTAEYENAFTIKDNKDVRPKMPKTENYDTSVRGIYKEKRNDGNTDTQSSVKSSDRQSYDSDAKPKIPPKPQRYTDSVQSNFMVDSISSIRRLKEETDTTRELARCINGHLYMKNHQNASDCPKCNVPSRGTRSKEPTDKLHRESLMKNPQTSSEISVKNAERPDIPFHISRIVDRMEEQRESSGVYKCIKGHAFAMNPEFVKDLGFKCTDCGRNLYPKEVLERIQQTKNSSNEPIKPDLRHSSDVNVQYRQNESPVADTLKYTQMTNQSSQSKDNFVKRVFEQPSNTSEGQTTEKNDSDKKKVVYMWFRCSKGHLYNRERGDPDQEICTKCGEKEGKSLV